MASSVGHGGLGAARPVAGHPGAREDRKARRDPSERDGAAGARVDDAAGEGEPGAAEAREQVREADEPAALRRAGRSTSSVVAAM